MESGRYHLYAGNACPWCHRCLLALAARGLSEHVSVGPLQDDAETARRGGWVFKGGRDPVTGSADLLGVYDKAKPGYIGTWPHGGGGRSRTLASLVCLLCRATSVSHR